MEIIGVTDLLKIAPSKRYFFTAVPRKDYIIPIIRLKSLNKKFPIKAKDTNTV